MSAEADFVDQIARKVNVWCILGRGIRILNWFPIIPGTLPDNTRQSYFRHTVVGAYLKSLGARKLGPRRISKRAIRIQYPILEITLTLPDNSGRPSITRTVASAYPKSLKVKKLGFWCISGW
ncbi:hypothetical protein TNCV_3971761 [Trichonephila clavipes]|nr:hypothetical protein TNCV_3971761 [Trichonephila clavipes]